jgi:cytochrome P450
MTNPISIDEQNQVCELFRYRNIQSVLSDPLLFSSQRYADTPGNPRIRGSLAVTDPPRHKQLRSLFSQAFTPRIIAQHAEHIRDIVNELLDASTASGTLEVIGHLAIPLPVRVIAELLGIPRSQQTDLKHRSPAVLGGSQEQAIASLEAFEEIIHTLLVQRRKERQSDLISALLAIEGDGEPPVSEEEIVDFCVSLLVGGHETTTMLIGNIILCLDEYPSSREQVWNDPSLLLSAIEEVLRFRSVTQRGTRLVTRDTEIGGKQLKAGYRVFYWSGSANRDEEYFPDPDVFDIRRSPNRHLGFGHGIHFCLGASLARLEARIALEQIIERFKDIQRVRDVPLQMIPNFNAHGVQQLPVRLEKR